MNAHYGKQNQKRGANGTIYEYDKNDCLIKEPRADGSTITYDWDVDDNIIKITYPDGTTTIEAAYDGMGNCVRMTDALGHVTEYEYNGNNEIVKVIRKGENGHDDIILTYAYAHLGNVTLIIDGEGNSYRMDYDKVGNLKTIYDAMGNVKSFTNPNGGVSEYTYDLNNRITGESIGSEYKHAYEYNANGQYGVASDDNGLYYMRARYYNVSIKRFINQDVVTGNLTESQSLNRYAYVEGNPVSYLDPFGLEPLLTGGLHDFATVASITGGAISGFFQEAGFFVGEFALAFDMGVYLNDFVTSGFDGNVVDEGAKSVATNLAFFTVGMIASAGGFGILSEEIALINTNTSVGVSTFEFVKKKVYNIIKEMIKQIKQ